MGRDEQREGGRRFFLCIILLSSSFISPSNMKQVTRQGNERVVLQSEYNQKKKRSRYHALSDASLGMEEVMVERLLELTLAEGVMSCSRWPSL